jgi:hypothetical protein
MCKQDEDAFSELVYEAWMTGRNPDMVSRDNFNYARSRGFYPDEISLNSIYPKRHNESEE